MQIQVQLFSSLRECLPPGAERGRATITLAEGATLAELVRYLGIDRFLGYEVDEIVGEAGWQVMVGGRYETNMERALQEGDEVLVLPFVSGGQ